MGFIRNIRPKSMFKRRADTKLKKNCKSVGIDDSGRTCDMDLDMKSSLDDSLHSDHDEDGPDADASLDDCLHVPQHDAHEDFLGLIDRRLSRRREGSLTRVSFLDEELGLAPRYVVTQVRYRPRTTADEKDELYFKDPRTSKRKVTFLDEELGLTPRHVVTQIRYRPRTTDQEKHELYYSSHDFGIFEQEDLYEKIEYEIGEIERTKKEQKKGVILAVDEMKIKNLMRRVELQCNFE